jgi:hypothetical protein
LSKKKTTNEALNSIGAAKVGPRPCITKKKERSEREKIIDYSLSQRVSTICCLKKSIYYFLSKNIMFHTFLKILDGTKQEKLQKFLTI